MSGPQRSLLWLAALMLLGLRACSPASSSTQAPFVPPAAQPLPSPSQQPAPTLVLEAPSPAPSTPTLSIAAALSPTSTVCTNDLSYGQDITVPDGSIVQPGASIDKQWMVTNTGTCNWDASYHLSLVGGEALGAASQQALYPARAGTQAILRILFTAPLEPGTYQSAWQAFAPDGTAFGDPIYMTISVSP